MSKTSFAERMTLAMGTVSLAAAPVAADASLITVTPSVGSVKISFSDPHMTIVPWDVDGVGQREFELELRLFQGSGPKYNNTGSRIALDSILSTSYVAGMGTNITPLNGRGFVGKPKMFISGTFVSTYADEQVNVLPSSFNVGPTLAGTYTFGDNPVQNIRHLLSRTNSTSSYGASVINRSYFGARDLVTSGGGTAGGGLHIIGFRFDPGDGLHYGWAEVDIDLMGESVEIVRWTYNDEAGQPVHVATEAGPVMPPPGVPEVSPLATMVPGLTLLGLGAAGVRRLRERRRAEANAA